MTAKRSAEYVLFFHVHILSQTFKHIVVTRMTLTEVARHLGTAVIREPRGLLRGYGQGGNSNRKIVIDVAVASSVQARNPKRQARPLVKAKAAADRKWRENHFRMPRHGEFKAVTFQA